MVEPVAQKPDANDLLSLIPAIRRARGYRLYDGSGRRYLDLYQDGGRSLLGHRPARMGAVLKNLISKGLISDLPSVYVGRLERALLRRFPGFSAARIAASRQAAVELASLFLGRRVEEGMILDPVRPPREAERAPEAELAYWRPFGPPPQPRLRVLLPIVPFAMARAPHLLCFREPPPEGFPPSDCLSPLLLAGALRALHDLESHRLADWYREDLLARAPGWLQRGIYVFSTAPAGGYREIFERFLQAGFLLSPRRDGPSILPAEASPGEVKKMIKLFRENPGK